MKQIASPHNPLLKRAARLRTRRGRNQQGRIIIDGMRETSRALQSNVVVLEVYVCLEMLQPRDVDMLQQHAEQCQAALVSVPPHLFTKLAFGDRADGVVAVAEPPETDLNQIQLSDCPLLAVVESVEKPGNLGAVLRSADATATDAVLVADGTTDLYNPNTIRASLGTVFTQQTAEAASDDILHWLTASKTQIYAARVDASVDYDEVDFCEPCAIVLGSEAKGLSDTWHRKQVIGIHLPMLGRADSLNLSVAASVLLYEARRQRTRR